MGNVYDINKKKRVEEPVKKQIPQEDFGDRVARIRASLDRINVLMAELKKMQHRNK